MGFELVVAAKRDPVGGTSEPTSRPLAACTTITLNGTFDRPAVETVLAAASDLFGNGTASILIFMEDVSVADTVCLRLFADGLMSLRSKGSQVQVCAGDAALHQQMSQIPTSRDWLIGPTADAGVARRALHFEGPAADQ